MIFFLLLLVPSAWGDQNVLGCGGFIKASKSIDFSKINVQLLTKQGGLKYETDCAPNNGYYFIPVYEKGEYILKVSPPLGWKFTPEEVSVTIDGETDDCSLNKDINFVFAGFGVVGRVVADGADKGPEGVDIELITGDEKVVVQKTVTVKDGKYVFTAVAGADHKVRAHHPVWQFEKSVGSVIITGDNGKAEDLIVAGFDVSGKVLAGEKPMAGVDIVLFGNKALKICADNSKSEISGPSGSIQVCKTSTNSAGEFVFPVVPGGKYFLLPFHKGQHTQFEVSPKQVEITVDLESVKLKDPFIVEGFSVKGKVLSGPQGNKLANTVVTVSGLKTHTTTTDKNGQYFIEKIESGTYTISAKSDGIQFSDLTAEISPSNPILPDLVAEKYLVSGQLDFSTVSSDSSRKVKLSSTGKLDMLISVENDGKFSIFLPSGAFSVSVVPSSVDTKMGIVFAPLALDIIVKSEPIGKLYFSPVRVTIAGSVRCTAECPSLTIQLTPEGPGEVSKQTVEKGKFSFQNQLPGRYSIAVEEAGLCWEKPSIVFNIESESKEDLDFVQTGWGMEIHSSHETTLKFKSKDEKITGEFLISGITKIIFEYQIYIKRIH